MRAIIFLFFVVSLTGCSANRMWFGSDVGRLSFVQLNGVVNDKGDVTKVVINKAKDDNANNDKHLGALIAWSPEFNAAYISVSGNGCIQPAMYSKTNSGNVNIPAELISKGMDKGALSGDFSQALEKLISVSDQSTFISIGVYGLCQMHANGGLNNDQLTELTKVLFEQAATIKSSTPPNEPKNNDGIEVKQKENDKPK